MTKKLIGVLFLGVVGTIAVILIAGGSVPFLSSTGGSDSSLFDLVDPTPQAPPTTYGGLITFQVKISNLGNNTSVTDDGNPLIVKYYREQPDGSLDFLAQSDDGTDGTEDLIVGVSNFIWAEVETASSPVPAVYVMWEATKNANGQYITQNPRFADEDKNNRPSYIFPLDVSVVKANADPNIQPAVLWTLKVVGDGDVDINSASSITSAGQGAVENLIDWRMTFDAQPNGYAITAIDIRINDTASTAIYDESASWIDVPNVAFAGGNQRILLTDMEESISSGVTTYRFNYCNPEKCNKFDGANIITVASSGSRILDIPVTITTGFDATDEGICVELSIDKIDQRNTITADEMTDDAQIDEGTGGSGTCTI